MTWDYQPGTFTPLTQAEVRSGRRASRLPQDEVDRRFYAIVTDLTGTPCELLAPDGTLAGYQQHTVWGTTIWKPGGAESPLRFPGQLHDPETGLHYNNQRYYDPLTGRYLTPDPLGLAPGPDPHAYVPNPATWTDPLGLNPCQGSPPGSDAGGPGAGINAGDLTMTRTVEQHITEYAKDGTLSRPYGSSRLTIQEIMNASAPVPDPGGVPGALRWDVPGTMNGTPGTWELVVNPGTKTILHFLFKGTK